MYRMICRLALVVALFGLVVPAATAGGMATVHLDSPPDKVVAGIPYRIGFMVMQHDITPVNLEEVLVSATHRDSGESYEVAAQQEGETGHYIADLIFPLAGSWKWMIIPAPFAGTSFESVMVHDSAASADDNSGSAGSVHPAHIHFGSCSDLGEVFFPLSDVVPDGLVQEGSLVSTSGKIGVETGAPVAISTSTIDVTIAELITGPHALNVHKSSAEIGTYLACGDLSGRLVNDELIIGLQQVNGSGDVGIAILREEKGQTIVNVYLVAVDAAVVTSGPTVTVEIIGSEGGWTFDPARVEIAAGTTVVWVNSTETSHTVTGKDLAFEDSGPFGTGESYQQTFTEPGIYGYYCSPHPFMTGTVVVTD